MKSVRPFVRYRVEVRRPARAINIPPKRLFSLPELTNLVELDLSFNFFDSIPIEAFQGLENLKFLNLGSNKIKVGKKGRKEPLLVYCGISGISIHLSLPFPDHQRGGPAHPVVPRVHRPEQKPHRRSYARHIPGDEQPEGTGLQRQHCLKGEVTLTRPSFAMPCGYSRNQMIKHCWAMAKVAQ